MTLSQAAVSPCHVGKMLGTAAKDLEPSQSPSICNPPPTGETDPRRLREQLPEHLPQLEAATQMPSR